MAAEGSKERIGESSKRDSIIMGKSGDDPEENAEAQQDDVSSNFAPRFLVNL
jgi:hypothetical protein